MTFVYFIISCKTHKQFPPSRRKRGCRSAGVFACVVYMCWSVGRLHLSHTWRSCSVAIAHESNFLFDRAKPRASSSLYHGRATRLTATIDFSQNEIVMVSSSLYSPRVCIFVLRVALRCVRPPNLSRLLNLRCHFTFFRSVARFFNQTGTRTIFHTHSC